MRNVIHRKIRAAFTGQHFFGALFLVLCLIQTGSRFFIHPHHQTSTSGELRPLFEAALKLFVNGDYAQAYSVYAKGLTQVRPADAETRARFLLGMGNCHLAMDQYRPALTTYNEALRIAPTHSRNDVYLKVAMSRASIYRRISDFGAASESLRQMESAIGSSQDPLVLAQAANVAREIDYSRSLRLYRAAVLASQNGDNRAVEATVWSALGYAHLLHNSLPEADQALTEAFRLRLAAAKRQIQSSYFYLGWLRRLQGDCIAANRLLERARELSSEPGAFIAEAYIDREVARCALALGDRRKALEYFDRSVRAASELRLITLPSESFRINAEADMQRLFSEYVQTGMEEFEKSGDPVYARRMFAVSEDSRSALFRSSLASITTFPPEYLRKLKEFRRELASSAGSPQSGDSAHLRALELELADMEASLGVAPVKNSQQIDERVGTEDPLRVIQRNLEPAEALISFHTSPGASFIWGVTKSSFEAHRLPPESVLQDRIKRLRESLQKRSSDWMPVARELSRLLFEGVSREVLSRPDWIVSLDGSLYELPLAALPVENGRYLGQVHTIRLTPTGLLSGPAEVAETNGRFLGVADPVYNRADNRLKVGDHPEQELTRLPGTIREVENCARAWNKGTSPVVLKGPAIDREVLMQQLNSRPSVLHFGTHVVPHRAAPDQIMIALGLKAGGEAEYLSPADIGRVRKPLGLVTLSGCSSGSGKSIPGLGLFGLTRAWLVAGASSVVASYWPIPDDQGQMLARMYAELAKNGGHTRPLQVAKALQQAQEEMRRAGNWQSHPSYWAAFFVVGKE